MRLLPAPRLLSLVGLLALASCEQHAPAGPQAVGCTAEEMRTRQARTPACQAQFQALLDKAEADRQRASAIKPAAPAPSRDRF
ncbi:hypothetical protein [Caulobacter sp. FWC26]|uniref:hypothetical protein n=1 Tax=Caulobacter sp. FWC26 TaxID=69665 RepID=UPI000FDADEF2|nr:hypothetical protein [Caulobacter sp. FWC26]